mgnify:CR=1 FL=1
MKLQTPIQIQLDDAFKTLVEVVDGRGAIVAYGVISVISERQKRQAIKAYKAAVKAISKLAG